MTTEPRPPLDIKEVLMELDLFKLVIRGQVAVEDAIDAAIITNGNNPTTIQIAASDEGFKTFGCGTWTRTQ